MGGGVALRNGSIGSWLAQSATLWLTGRGKLVYKNVVRNVYFCQSTGVVAPAAPVVPLPMFPTVEPLRYGPLRYGHLP